MHVPPLFRYALLSPLLSPLTSRLGVKSVALPSSRRAAVSLERLRARSGASGSFAATMILLTIATTTLGLVGTGSVQAASPKSPAVNSGTNGSAIPALSGGADRTDAYGAALSDSILDEVGRLNRNVTEAQAQAWIGELHYTSATLLPARRSAWLHLRVGEWKLAKLEEPGKAAWHFAAARKQLSPRDPLYGQAVYNSGIARYWQGDYTGAITTFRFLIKPKSGIVGGGYVPSRASFWLTHAGACAGYHAEHARIGIPQPPRFDPECAAAGLAMSLKRLGLPFDRKSVLPHIRVTGKGSNASDIVRACRNITNSVADKSFGAGGVVARILTVNPAGLRALPLPALAFVEHDHYVAVLAADKAGVTYSCSDCGAWPGGLVRLSWKQWRRMDVGAVLPIVKKGSAEDEALALLLGEKAGEKAASNKAGEQEALATTTRGATRARRVALVSRALVQRFGVRVASAAKVASAPGGQDAAFVQRVAVLLGRMMGSRATTAMTAVAAVAAAAPPGGGGDVDIVGGGDPLIQGKAWVPDEDLGEYSNCGGDLYTHRCTFATVCPNHNNGKGQGGPSCGDPVNLATLEEEYQPEPDLVVYNPRGPSISWGRIYNSMRGPGDVLVGTPGYGLHLSGFGAGWSNTYNVYSIPMTPTASTQNWLVLQNGARIPLSASVMPTASVPNVAISIPSGFPFTVTWTYNGSSTYYLLTWKDGSKWRVTSDGIEGIRDPNGRSLFFDRTTGNLLKIRQDSATGPVLLTVVGWTTGHSSGSITEVQDCYGRSVFYQNATYKVAYFADPYNPIAYCPLLTEVSQILQTGTAPGVNQWRYKYDYGGVMMGGGANFPTLNKFTTPSPTGSGLSSDATLDYWNDGSMYVKSHTDARGILTKFTRVTTTRTLVEVPSVGLRYMAGFDNLKAKTQQTDNTVAANGTGGHLIFEAAYGANDFNPDWVKDGTGLQTSYGWDTYGNLTSVTPPGGLSTTTYAYDYTVFPLGRLQSVTTTGGGVTRTPTTLTYFPTGNPKLVKKVEYPSPLGGTLTEYAEFTYDYLGNVVSVDAPNANSGSRLVTTLEYVNDTNIGGAAFSQPGGLPRMGQPLSISQQPSGGTSRAVAHFRYDVAARGNVTASWGLPKGGLPSEALYGLTETEYNIADQPVKTWLPARNVGASRGFSAATYLYPGGPAATVKFYDETNYTTPIRTASPKFGMEGEPLGGQSPSTGNIATQELDNAYRPTKITDTMGRVTNYVYHLGGTYNGRLAEIRLPGWTSGNVKDSVQFIGYDGAGRLTKRVDGKGVETEMTYEPATGWLSSVTIKNPGQTATPWASYSYDAYGRLLTRTDNSGVETTAYNDADAVTSVTTAYTSLLPKAIGYTYNPDGSRMGMTTPGGNFGYAYDGYGRPTGVATSFGHVAGWTYWNNDALKYQAVSNAPASSIHLTTYNANGLGQLASLVNQQGSVASPGAVLSQFDSTLYDGAGNLTQVVRQVAAASSVSPYSDTLQFQYNAKDELTQEKFLNNGGSPYVYNFAFDNAGNPTTFRNASRTYNANNQLTGPASYAYDGNGNPTTYRGANLTFDAGNNPTSISLGTGITAGYTSGGVRAWKQSGTVRTYFLYDGTAPVVEMDGNGAVKAVNTFGLAGLVSRYYPGMFGASNSVFYTFDETGNVSQRFDGVGALLSTHGFQAYGQHVSTLTGGVNPDPWGYKAQSGYYTDQETGLVLCTLRYYDPANGRWINRDPIGSAGGLNLYGYCGGNPVMGLDPLGLYETGSYWGDVGQFGLGEAKALGMAAGYGLAFCLAPEVMIPLTVGMIGYNMYHCGVGNTLEGIGNSFNFLGAGSMQEAGERFGNGLSLFLPAPRGSNGCFAAGTPVAMADGSYKPIEQVKEGDLVLSRDTVTGYTTGKRVEQTSVRQVGATLTLTFTSGAVIETTDEHPLFVSGMGFVPAKSVGIGTEIVTRAGPNLVVAKVERKAVSTTVYNFTVEGFHTYFVGNPTTTGGGLWVHNANCTPAQIANAEAALAEHGDLWSGSGYKSAAESLADHFDRKGWTVGADNVAQYLRKAAAFSQEMKRATPKSSRDNGTRYEKQVGKYDVKYIIIENDTKKIISFGRN